MKTTEHIILTTILHLLHNVIYVMVNNVKMSIIYNKDKTVLLLVQGKFEQIKWSRISRFDNLPYGIW